MYTVCISGKQFKRERERFRTDAVRREGDASIAKSNLEHLTRDNNHLRRESMPLYKNIRRGMQALGVNVDGWCFPRHIF